MEPNDPKPTLHVYEFGDFRLDTLNERLFENGQPGKIQPMQLRLLCYLIENRGREISSEELFSHLWGRSLRPLGRSAMEKQDRQNDLNNLHVQFKLLRRVIRDTKAKLIENRRGCYFVDKESVTVIPWPPPRITDLAFKDWLLRSRECLRIKLFLAAGVLLSILYPFAYLLLLRLSPGPTPAWFTAWFSPGVALCVIQFVVVSVALGASSFIFDRNVKDFPASPEADAALMKISGYAAHPEKWPDAKAGAKSSLNQYSRYWKFLLISWACLYFFLIFTIRFLAQVLAQAEKVADPVLKQQVLNDPSHTYWFFNIASTVFNNCNSLAIALCYVVLNHPTVFRKGAENAGLDRVTRLLIRLGLLTEEDVKNTTLARVTRLLFCFGVLTIVVFTLVECVLVYCPLPEWYAWMRRQNYVWALDLLSGLAGAITLALYVGRIQSKFLGPTTWLPLALYLYVAIQSLYVAILGGEKWGAVIIEAALILKCLLYLYVAWLFKSGRLLFYLVRVRTVYERVNLEWDDFLANLNREK